MSRTRRKTSWQPNRFYSESKWARPNEWWDEVFLQLTRGHRSGKGTAIPTRGGGWCGYHFGWRDIPGRNCRKQKRYEKRLCSKMRRREAKHRLRKSWY